MSERCVKMGVETIGRSIRTFFAAGFLLSLSEFSFGFGDSADPNQISQFGITWTFAQGLDQQGTDPYTCGQYVSGEDGLGDWWVVGPVVITDIDPNTHMTDGVETDRFGNVFPVGVINGSMLNPMPDPVSTNQGFLSITSYAFEYQEALNAAAHLPLEIATGSLISTESQVADPNINSFIYQAAVLTVVPSPPPPGAFRPAYSGTNKVSKYTAADVDLSRLRRLEPVNDTRDLGWLEEELRGPCIDIYGGPAGRVIQPEANMAVYGGRISSVVEWTSLALNVKYAEDPNEDYMIKRDLLHYFIQYGIDLWGVVESGGNPWRMQGGHGPGRKFPILFAGHLLHDPNMLDVGKRDLDDPYFGEDQVCYYLYRSEVERYIGEDGLYPENNTHRLFPDAYYQEVDFFSGRRLTMSNTPAWMFGHDYYHSSLVYLGPEFYFCHRGHTADHTNQPGVGANWKNYWRICEGGYLGMPEYGKEYWGYENSTFQGRWISRRPDASYRMNHSWPVDGYVLAARLMGLKDEWHHDALFDYTDRFRLEFYEPRDFFIDNMWAAYRLANEAPIIEGISTDAGGEIVLSVSDSTVLYPIVTNDDMTYFHWELLGCDPNLFLDPNTAPDPNLCVDPNFLSHITFWPDENTMNPTVIFDREILGPQLRLPEGKGRPVTFMLTVTDSFLQTDVDTVTVWIRDPDCSIAVQERGWAIDLNGDCRVNLADLALLTGRWMSCYDPLDTDSGCINPYAGP